jgi:hypothetical protein
VRNEQRRVLGCIASDAPLEEVLDTLVRLVEEQADLRCAVLLADATQQRLRFIAAPHIPEDYRVSIEPYLPHRGKYESVRHGRVQAATGLYPGRGRRSSLGGPERGRRPQWIPGNLIHADRFRLQYGSRDVRHVLRRAPPAD